MSESRAAELKEGMTILMPDMAPIQFPVIAAALSSEGFHTELLDNSSLTAAETGLQYVNNDTCYPAILIIGQFIEALNSGKYDPGKTALLISQSGGGCRASNYISLLRKALKKAGYENVPVFSANASGLEKDNAFPFTLRLIRKLLAAAEYGDLLMSLRNQVTPYEINTGDTEKLTEQWIDTISEWMKHNSHISLYAMKHEFRNIAESYKNIPMNHADKIRVGIVGEIYVKFSPAGNNQLVRFLEAEDCEVSMPGLMGYIEYCIANWMLDIQYYGGSKLKKRLYLILLKKLDQITAVMDKALSQAGFRTEGSFRNVMEKADRIIHLGAKMGEGWLLSGEMAELIGSGFPNIICAQPFGCLPNHIMGKGIMHKMHEQFPEANITAVDYDPGAARVNQENRIRLMLAVARENLNTD